MGETRPGGRIRDIPKEQRGASPARISKPDGNILSDSQIEEEFLASFAQLNEPVIQNPVVSELPGERVIGEKPKSPNSYALPKGVVFYDEEGKEALKLDSQTYVDGEWAPRPAKGTGPARFMVTKIYSNGLQNPGVEVRGMSAKRKGKLWYGQTASEIKEPQR